MKALWSGIESWLRHNAPEVLEQLRPPARLAVIQAVEQTLRRPLPEDFRGSLEFHDGTSPELGLLGGRELLALAQAQETWRRYCRKVRAPRNRWWPIAHDPDRSDSYFLCLDQGGRVVASWHHRSDPIVVAPSFRSWLAALLSDMQAGIVSVEGGHLKLSRGGAFRWPSPRRFAFTYGPASRARPRDRDRLPQEGIYDRLFERRFASLTAFADGRPTATLEQLARELSPEKGVAAVQLAVELEGVLRHEA